LIGRAAVAASAGAALLLGSAATGLAAPDQPAAASAPPGPPSTTQALPGLPPPGTQITAADLAGATAQVAQLMAQAQAAQARLETAAARVETLRVQYDRLLMTRYQVGQEFDAAVRRAYENYQPNPFGGLVAGLSLDEAPTTNLAQRNVLGVDRHLVAEVTRAGAAVSGLQQRLERVRRALLGPAGDAESALEQASVILALEEQTYGAQQAALLSAQQAELAQLSAQVTTAVAVTATPGELQTAQQQAPIIRAITAAGPGIPAGYTMTNQGVDGIASWYGPGFIGSPTSSGAPYDPSKLTCAMLLVPLGTVVHVSTGTHAVNCLVNDRGPYVPGRVIDMSEAGAAALDYTGLAEVRVTALRPTS
jgi:rare lipoprotein A (peptidoglycan hydrolase)